MTFTLSATAGALPNTLYQLTIAGTGASAVTDIAGNDLAGTFNGSFPTSGTPANFVATYGLDQASSANILFVGQPANVTNGTAPAGSFTNPFLTIQAAITAANPGDTIAVFPGVYTESDTLKPFIHLESAALTSTASTIVPGNALDTVIRAPAPAVPTLAAPETAYATLTAANLPFFPGLTTEVSGFTIASPLVGAQTGQNFTGPIDTFSTGVSITNSNLLLDRNYIIDSQNGVQVNTTGASAPTPQLISDVVVGNVNGIVLNDTSTSLVAPTQIITSDIADNTIGVQANASINSATIGNIVNDIFWQNHDLTSARNGFAISATLQNRLTVRNNMFFDNGVSDTNYADETNNVGGSFDPSKLSTKPDAMNNYVGNPAFVAPRDPRPNADGPGTFFNDANFGITANSAAIDAADSYTAQGTDFLFNARVRDPGHVSVTGFGPADIGAFEFIPNGSTTPVTPPVVGFGVVSSSIDLVNGKQVTYSASSPPKSIILTFSEAVNASSIPITSLTLTGSGLNPVGPARVVSVTQIAFNKVSFNLSNGFSQSGTVTVKIATSAFKATSGDSVTAYTGSFLISTAASTSGSIKAAAVTVTVPGVSSSSTIKAASITPVVVAPAAKTVTVPKGPLTTAAKLLLRRLTKKA